MSCGGNERLCSMTLWYSPPVPLCSACHICGDLALGGAPVPEGTWPRQPHRELLPAPVWRGRQGRWCGGCFSHNALTSPLR